MTDTATDWKTIEVLPEAMVRGEDGALRLTVQVPRSIEDWRAHVVFTRPGCAPPDPGFAALVRAAAMEVAATIADSYFIRDKHEGSLFAKHVAREIREAAQKKRAAPAAAEA